MTLGRRRLLSVAGGLALPLALAGCTENGATDDDDENDSGADGTPTDGEDSTETSEAVTDDGTATGTDDLDLREANVTGVEFERQDDGEYDVSVTLIHDDDGEEGYANWWQLETLDGDRLGRRELAHPHGTREFTRSETIAVPDDVDCAVVRGHDQTHEYGGQAALVDLESGATRTVQQGSDPETFGEGDCP